MKPGHPPIKQEARPISYPLQNFVEKILNNLFESGHLERVQKVDEDCFVSPVVLTLKNDKSVKTALRSIKLNDSCKKMGPHMPNMEQILNQKSYEITNKSTEQAKAIKDMEGRS